MRYTSDWMEYPLNVPYNGPDVYPVPIEKHDEDTGEVTNTFLTIASPYIPQSQKEVML